MLAALLVGIEQRFSPTKQDRGDRMARGSGSPVAAPEIHLERAVHRKSTGTNHARVHMATSYPDENGKSAIKHPDTSVPTDVLHAAYVAVLAVIARYEPEALLRVARVLSDDGSLLSSRPPAGTAAELARAWLAFTGQGADVVASPPERVFGFAFPATMTFEVVGRGTPKSVARRAMRALRALQAEDVPLGAVAGSHPTSPELLNVTIWAGSFLKTGDDRLVLELATDDGAVETS